MKKSMARGTDRAVANVYREAARILETDPNPCGCCWAIGTAARRIAPTMESHYGSPLHDRADAVFKWYDNWYGGYNTKKRGPRILALCFMAAMVEAGDA